MKTWHWILIAAVILLLTVGGGVAVVKVIASKSEEAKLAGLLPQVRAALQRGRVDLRGQGIETTVAETLRDPAYQESLVAGGKSATSHSWHLLGRAVDLYPHDKAGKVDIAGKDVELFRTMQLTMARYGFKNLAFNPDGSRRYITTTAGKVWDGGHIEYPEGLTFAQAAQMQGVKIA